MLIEILPDMETSGIAAHRVGQTSVAGEFLAGYINSDIQGVASEARRILAHLDAVRSGNELEWTESGNAYVVTAKLDGVVLDFHWADEGQPDTAHLPLDAVREAVAAWLAALERKAISV